jgi:ERCC4-type nuclease
MLMIDKREKSELASLIIKRAELIHIPYEFKWLEIGDYVLHVEPSICFEAKSIQDFLNSIRNKRMFNQISNMEDAYDKNIILIHGPLEDAVKYLENVEYNNIRWKNKLKGMICGAIASINLHTTSKCLWVPSVDEAAHIVIASCTQVNKPLILTKQLPKKTRSEDVRVDVLVGIDGVSEKKARDLLKMFGSIEEISSISIEDIIKIKGIGKVTAGNIIKTLTSETKVNI